VGWAHRRRAIVEDHGMRAISNDERRARLARRHRIAGGERAADAVAAAESVVCLHGTDPATIFLSAWARVDALEVADVQRALYAERSLVKHLAMRRTLFVVPRATLADVQAAASGRVADRERRRLVREVEQAGLHRDGARWLAEASAQVLELLSDGRDASSSQLRDAIPSLEGTITYGAGKSWGGKMPVGPRVLTVLSAEGRIVRGPNDGGWTASRPRWVSTRAWLGEEIEPRPAAAGTRSMVERWLRAFGPGTELDLKWWLGSTLSAVRGALAELGAVAVALEDGRTGYLLPDDLEPTAPVAPWAALLPPLDPTTMGWFERDWYLGPHKAQLFDTTGNGGPTAWWDGRIVGGWRQDDDGAVELQLLEDAGSDALRSLRDEAARLTTWFAGTKVLARFPSPLSKALADAVR
jgi:hypothetical protein